MLGRLTKEDVREVTRKLPEYDAELVRKTGLSLKEIAGRSAEVSEKNARATIGLHRVVVVRITSGQGIIENFAEAVKGILIYMGAEAFITRDSDVAGLAEGIENKGDIVFLADDNRFIALSLPLGKIIDNAEATAKGYVTALEAMAGGLTQRQVLVIGGAGRVGWNAVLSLQKRGAKVAVCDPDQDRLKSLAEGHEITVESDLEEALGRYTVCFDASPADDIIQSHHITSETLIAAPGIPLGLAEEAYSMVKERLIHDVLEIGVATMLVQAAVFSEGW